MEKPIIAGIGEVLWDMFLDGRCLGGAPANFAYHAQQHGAEAFIVSAVGADSDGQAILDELAFRGLSLEYIAAIPDHPTGTVTVELTDGMPSYNIHAPVAWDFIPWSNHLKQLAQEADAVCFGSLAQRNPSSAETIKLFLEHTGSNCLKVFDINLRQSFYNREIIEFSLRNCNLLKVNDKELPVIAEMFGLGSVVDKAIKLLMEKYMLNCLVLTKGKNGSVFYDGSQRIFTPVYDYGPKIDTVGCGDCFTATLVTGLLSGLQPEEAMTHASKAAGSVCASIGAMVEMPEILRINYKNNDDLKA
jgi:fructokinase